MNFLFFLKTTYVHRERDQYSDRTNIIIGNLLQGIFYLKPRIEGSALAKEIKLKIKMKRSQYNNNIIRNKKK